MSRNINRQKGDSKDTLLDQKNQEINFLQKQLEELTIRLTEEKTNKEKQFKELSQIQVDLQTKIGDDAQSLISSLQENQIIKNKNKRISYLEEKIEELSNLIKKQKEKIIDAYLYFAPEKILLRELISIHIEFSKTKREQSPVGKIREQFNEVHTVLKDKIKEEEIEKVEIILTDCEDMVNLEYQLAESKVELKEGKEFIRESESYVFNMIHNINVREGNALIGNNLRNNANFSYNKKRLEFQSRVEIPPKSN